MGMFSREPSRLLEPGRLADGGNLEIEDAWSTLVVRLDEWARRESYAEEDAEEKRAKGEVFLNACVPTTQAASANIEERMVGIREVCRT